MQTPFGCLTFTVDSELRQLDWYAITCCSNQLKQLVKQRMIGDDLSRLDSARLVGLFGYQSKLPRLILFSYVSLDEVLLYIIHQRYAAGFTISGYHQLEVAITPEIGNSPSYTARFRVVSQVPHRSLLMRWLGWLEPLGESGPELSANKEPGSPTRVQVNVVVPQL